jgi:DnaK suppressor protein
MWQLLQNRRELQAAIANYKAKLRIPVDPDIDEADPSLAEHDLARALLRQTQQALLAVERALTHTKNGTYGLCETCGHTIPAERLEIFPETTLCVPCKTAQEGQRR